MYIKTFKLCSFELTYDVVDMTGLGDIHVLVFLNERILVAGCSRCIVIQTMVLQFEPWPLGTVLVCGAKSLSLTKELTPGVPNICIDNTVATKALPFMYTGDQSQFQAFCFGYCHRAGKNRMTVSVADGRLYETKTKLCSYIVRCPVHMTTQRAIHLPLAGLYISTPIWLLTKATLLSLCDNYSQSGGEYLGNCWR